MVTVLGSKPYTSQAAFSQSASASVRVRRSSMSKTPSARRRKKRGMPCSRTLPRGARKLAVGSRRCASGKRLFSLPPVPWSMMSVRVACLEGSQRWWWVESMMSVTEDQEWPTTEPPGSVMRGTVCSMRARACSYCGGSLSAPPSAASGSSVAKPGESVANSKRTWPGSRK